jgi:hypothetical protein
VGREPEIILNIIAPTGITTGWKIKPKFKFRLDGVEIDPKFKFCVLGAIIVPMLTTGIAGPVKLDPATSWMLIGVPSIHGARLPGVDHAIVIDIF